MVNRFLARMSAVAVLLAACVSIPANAQDRNAEWSRDPASGCSFAVPSSFSPGPVHWTGECTLGKASGLGMLRRRDGQETGEVFYGELREGVPVIGAIDFSRGDQGGLSAGRWKDGDIASEGDDQWNDRIDGFTMAARAARSVSARFKAQGNLSSARFYERQAKMLEMQVE